MMGTKPQIEKGIPLPLKNTRSKRWDFIEEMEPFDSVFLSFAEYGENIQSNWRANAKHCVPRDATFISRKVDGGIRIWRLS